MWYVLPDTNKQYPLSIQRVKEIQRLNSRGEKVEELQPVELIGSKAVETEHGFVELVGQISLRSLEKTSKRSKDKGDRERDNRPPERRHGERPQDRRPNERPQDKKPAERQPERRNNERPPDRKNNDRPPGKPNFVPKKPPQNPPPPPAK